MHKLIKTTLTLLVCSSLISCGSLMTKPEKKSDKPEFAGDMLTFSEVIGDQPETNVRMIITEGFMRMDEGPQAEDYLLFNRKTKTIYNIVAEEQSILIMQPGDVKLKSPYPILWNVESQTSNALMRTDNKNIASATHYRLKLNQKECYNMVTVDQGMDKALAVIREFRQVLANQLKTQYTPQKKQECYEAVNIFTPLNHLHQGFPIREWSAYGYQRFLINQRKMIIFPKRLFELPAGYDQLKL